jgi:hypothetical protein
MGDGESGGDGERHRERRERRGWGIGDTVRKI